MEAQWLGKLAKNKPPFRGRGEIFSLDKPPLLVGWLVYVILVAASPRCKIPGKRGKTHNPCLT
jgi:hypothetical protein